MSDMSGSHKMLLEDVVLEIFKKKFNVENASVDDEWGRKFGCYDEDVVDILMEVEKVTGMKVDELVVSYDELARRGPFEILRWLRRVPSRPGLTARIVAGLLSAAP